MLAHPIHYSETPPVYEKHPPLMGEHNEAILTELGYSPSEIRSILS